MIKDKSYKLKKTYQNGTTHVVLSPLDFLSRLSALIPRPKIHLTRFHGVFAPHFKYRSLIIPNTNSKKTSSEEKTENKETRKSYSMGWAKRLKRVFGIDIQTCSRCGGKIKVISAIEEAHVIQKILTHRGRDCQHSQTLSAINAISLKKEFSINSFSKKYPLFFLYSTLCFK